MFCSKCGAKISESDQFCPACGKENINFIDPNSAATEGATISETQKRQNSFIGDAGTDTNKGKKTPRIITIGVIAVVAIVGIILICMKGSDLFSSSDSKITWSPFGLYGYVDTEGSIHFIENGTVTSFDGKMKSGLSTPDHSKYLTLSEDGSLQVSVLQDGTCSSTTIEEQECSIIAVNNDGCFYSSGGREHLYYYSFSDNSKIDTGLEDQSYYPSQNKNTVVGLNESGAMSMFSRTESSSRALCNTDSEADICCVADDGSNVVWAVKDGNSYGIYMLKNGAPERIGKITNSEKYSYVSGIFYNDDKSFMIYSPSSPQMIVNQNGDIKELALPGVKGYGTFYDGNGQYMDSDDDNISEPYLVVKKNKNADTGGLYKLSKDGSFVLEADDIYLDSSWDPAASPYYIRDSAVYYINKDGDLYMKQLGEEDEPSLITTDVKAFYIPEAGQYCYVVKAGSLYYLDLSDNDYKLNMIWNNLTEDDTVKFTDKPNVLYFISDSHDIPDSYRSKGTLYQYVIGSEPKELARNIMSIQRNGAKSFSADYPVFVQYVSHKDYDYVVNIGTCSNGEYKELIKNVLE